MPFPTEEEARLITKRSISREKRRLERKIRKEQMEKNDAWLRADAVYKAEFEKLREKVGVLEHEVERTKDINKNLARALSSLLGTDGKTTVHIRFLD